MNNAVKKYQCPGCLFDGSCFESSDSLACNKHNPATYILSIGKVFLGLPKGFNRLGSCEDTKIYIFEKFEDGWGYDKFNIPVWKHLDDGDTIVRGISPRINETWIHIFLEDCISEINCLEITNQDINKMD